MISFFVNGLPKPAGSKRGFYIEKIKRVVITDACKTSRDWKTTVSWTAKQNFTWPLLQGPLEVKFVFYLPRPKSHYHTGKHSGLLRIDAPKYHASRPDALKLSRAVEDALTSIIWQDDAQIAHETLWKLYSNDGKVGVQIEINEAV